MFENQFGVTACDDLLAGKEKVLSTHHGVCYSFNYNPHWKNGQMQGPTLVTSLSGNIPTYVKSKKRTP